MTAAVIEEVSLCFLSEFRKSGDYAGLADGLGMNTHKHICVPDMF